MNLLRVSFTAAGQKTFRHILHNTVSSNVNTMIRGFATAADNLESEKVVEKMNPSGDCVSYNTLISDMSKAFEVSSAVEISEQMRRLKELSPNKITFTSLIDSLCKEDRFDDAYRFLNEMIASGFSPSVVTLKDVLHGFLRIGETKKAYEMYNEMRIQRLIRYRYLCSIFDDDIKERWIIDNDTRSLLIQGVSDEVSYTSLMNAYLDEGKWDNAEKLYCEMGSFGSLPDSVRYSVFINGLDDNKARTTQIKKELLDYNYCLILDSPILEFRRTLVENCSDDEFKSVVELVEGICIKGLENVFDTILKSNYKPNGIDDGIVYNLFIIEHCKHSNVDEAYIMYKDMVHYGFACHMFTVFALIETLQEQDMVNELCWVIQNVLRSCNLNDSEILKFFNEFNPEDPGSEAFFYVLAEKAKDGLFLKCSYAPTSA